MSDNTIRILIIDDSAVVRGLFSRALTDESDMEVVGTAMNGQMGLSEMKSHPADIVILDVEMPVMDGLETLQHLRRDYPDTQVIMASTLTYKGAETTLRALSLGAAACVAKPATSSLAASIGSLKQELIPLIRALAGKNKKKSPSASVEAPAAVLPPEKKLERPAAPIQVVVIGTSTGGPQALNTVLTGLPSDFPLPILIVQHMPPHFTAMLAKHLEKDTGRPCREAEDGLPIERGKTYVAPGDFHMEIDKRGDRMVTVLTKDPPEHYCRPSVNPLFRTAGEWYGKTVLGVMLTGMGEDGIEGAQTLVEHSGFLIAQDEATSVVWGMPGAVVRAGLAHRVLPLGKIAESILELCTAAPLFTSAS